MGGGGNLTRAVTATHEGRAAPSDRRRGAAAAPRLEFSTAKLDLGDGKPNEILRGELTLTNPGREPAKFSLVKHCGCTELSPMSGELAAGAAETIHVGVQLPGYANSEKNTSIEVNAGDPPTTIARCSLAARCPAPFHVEPAFISFGLVDVEELGAASQDIRIGSLEGQPPFDAEKLVIDHSGDTFRVERQLVATAGAIMLRVSINAGVAPGDYYDALDLRTSGSEYSMRVPLHLTLADAISVSPAKVVLHRAADTGAFKPVQLFVMSRAGVELPDSISLVDAPAGLSLMDLGKSGKRGRRVQLLVSGDISAWPRESKIWLQGASASPKFAFSLIKPSHQPEPAP